MSITRNTTRTSARAHTPRRGPRFVSSVALLALASAAGCSGPRNFDNENDALRRQVKGLQTQLAQSDARAAELDAKLAQAHTAAAGSLSQEARDALPVCASIQIDRLSGFDPDPANRITVEIATLDGRQRFVQVAATLAIEARLLPPIDPAVPADSAADSAPVLARLTLSPAQLREAYVSGLGGTYYRAQLTVDPMPTLPPGSRLLLRATLADALTGKTHTAERISPIR